MKLIVLDRDGVINQDSSEFVKTADEWIALPGSLEAIARFYHAGYKVVVATNQSGLGRGLFTIHDLHAMHEKLQAGLREFGAKIDAFFICPHHPDEGCNCRKPAPGMFQDIIRRYEIRPHSMIAVGDSLRDLQAAASAGFSPYLVLTGNGLKTQATGGLPKRTQIRADLAAIADELLEE